MYSVKSGPSCQKTSPICVAMPTGPETGGGPVGFVATEWTSAPRPPRMSPSASTVRWAPSRIASDRRVLDGMAGRHDLEVADPDRALLGGDLLGRAQRRGDGDVADAGPLDADRDGLARVRREAVDQGDAVEGAEVLAVDRGEHVAGLDAGRLGGRAGLHGADLEADRRVAVEREPREDRERQQHVHQHAGDEDPEANRQRLRGERARVVGGIAVLALELDEPAERQPVERVEGLALRAQDLRPRREADPELEDAHVRRGARSRSGRARG